jgi:hypothetical protein
LDKQQQIDKIKTTLAAVDNAIAQTQAALQSPATSAGDILALRSTLIDLQAQRSQLATDLINLQASQTEVEGLVAAAGRSASVSSSESFTQMTSEQATEIDSVHRQLEASIVDRSVIQATLDHATAVSDNASRLRHLLKPAGKAAHSDKG